MRSRAGLLSCALGVAAALVVLTTPASAISGSVVAPGQVIALTAGGPMTAPVDGRLRGPDVTAEVTGVAWPASVPSHTGQFVAGTGQRLVEFSLRMTQPKDDVGPFVMDPSKEATASLEVDGSGQSVDLSAIDGQIETSSGSGNGTGSGVFMASVPATTHDVELQLTEGGFQQSISLWTLRRLPPAPTVLYRDLTSSEVADNVPASATISVDGPTDGFTSQVDVDLTTATLSAFAPADADLPTASGDEAYLILKLTATDPEASSYANDLAPLPGSGLTFTAPGAPPVAATAVDPVSQADQFTGGTDSGLLDATYVFTVPASTTTGTVTIGPAVDSGLEQTSLPPDALVPLAVGGPTVLPVDFTATAPPPRHQSRPPWVGAPLPPTGSSAASVVPGVATGRDSGGSGGFPVWVAVVIVLAVAAAVVPAERAVRRRRSRTEADADGSPSTAAERSSIATPEDGAHVRTVVPTTAVHQDQGSNGPNEAGPPSPHGVSDDGLGGVHDLVVRVLGPVSVTGWRLPPDRAVTERLCCYLALQEGRPVGSDHLVVDLWPTESTERDVSRKTLRNYLSRLRQAVGPERFPDATTTGGYVLTGVVTDWGRFQELAAEADASSDVEADELRAKALALVRGEPFTSARPASFEWAHTSLLVSRITVAIVEVAHRLAADRLARGDDAGAERAARQGLVGAPHEELLWVDVSRAVLARGDRPAVSRLRRDLVAALGPDVARVVEADAAGGAAVE